MSKYLPYDPGSLPTKKSLSPGEELHIQLDGLPPIKKQGMSLRNPKNPRYDAFVALREAATKAMNGRAWYFGPVALDLTIYDKNKLDSWGLNDYMGGIMDTLDGSSGIHFTYLPIVFEDDCQVSDGRARFIRADSPKYELKITFL
jgi:hypothetical protein